MRVVGMGPYPSVRSSPETGKGRECRRGTAVDAEVSFADEGGGHRSLVNADSGHGGRVAQGQEFRRRQGAHADGRPASSRTGSRAARTSPAPTYDTCSARPGGPERAAQASTVVVSGSCVTPSGLLPDTLRRLATPWRPHAEDHAAGALPKCTPRRAPAWIMAGRARQRSGAPGTPGHAREVRAATRNSSPTLTTIPAPMTGTRAGKPQEPATSPNSGGPSSAPRLPSWATTPLPTSAWSRRSRIMGRTAKTS